PAVGQISVHTFDLSQIPGYAYRTHIHFQFLVPTVVTVGKGKVYSFIVPQFHSTPYQSPDSINVITDGITHILYLSSVAQFPESSLTVLFFNGRDIFCDMAMETVAHVWTVRHAFHNAVHLPELLYLPSAQTFCRSAVNGIQIAVLFLILLHFSVDILESLQSKLSVLPDRLSIVELLKLI